MSEHSIEELERQWKQAEDKAKEANLREREAKRRLLDAKFEATGFKDCAAEFKTRRGYGSRVTTSTVMFLPKRIDLWGTYIEGPMIRKDGTVGEREVRCRASDATNLGPYTPPA